MALFQSTPTAAAAATTATSPNFPTATDPSLLALDVLDTLHTRLHTVPALQHALILSGLSPSVMNLHSPSQLPLLQETIELETWGTNCPVHSLQDLYQITKYMQPQPHPITGVLTTPNPEDCNYMDWDEFEGSWSAGARDSEDATLRAHIELLYALSATASSLCPNAVEARKDHAEFYRDLRATYQELRDEFMFDRERRLGKYWIARDIGLMRDEGEGVLAALDYITQFLKDGGVGIAEGWLTERGELEGREGIPEEDKRRIRKGKLAMVGCDRGGWGEWVWGCEDFTYGGGCSCAQEGGMFFLGDCEWE